MTSVKEMHGELLLILFLTKWELKEKKGGISLSDNAR